MNGLTKSETRYYQMPIMRKGLSIMPIFVKCKAISQDASRRTSRRFLSLWNVFDPIKRTLQLYQYLSPKSNLFHDEFSVYVHRNNMSKESDCSTLFQPLLKCVIIIIRYCYTSIINTLILYQLCLSRLVDWVWFKIASSQPSWTSLQRWGSSISFISLLRVNGAW